MDDFDFSNFLKSIATPKVSMPPGPPLPDSSLSQREDSPVAPVPQGISSPKDTTASSSDKLDMISNTGDGAAATSSDCNSNQNAGPQPRDWLSGTGNGVNGVNGEKRGGSGGIASRLPMERHVRVEAASWRGEPKDGVPQLQVRPVTTLKDPLGDKRIPLTQVAVNRRFLCYALKKGDVRAMDRIVGVRTLIKQHSGVVSDMKFLSYDDDWLLTAGLDHKIVIQELKSDTMGIQHRILLQIQLQVPLPTLSDAPVRAVWAPRHEKFIVFAVQCSVYLCSVERAFRGRHIRDASGYLSDLDWDSGAVVALKVGENNAAFGQLPAECSEELTVLNGNDDEGLISAASMDGQVWLWNLEEHDLFAFLDQEEPIKPFLTFCPCNTQPVQYVGWCPTSGSSCLLTVSGVTPFQCLKLWKYELGSPTASNQSQSPPIELQSLEMADDGESEGSTGGYGTVLVAKEAELLLLADVKEPSMIVLHTLEDEPGRLMFESFAQFRLKQPILSMVMDGETSGQAGTGSHFDVYSVQAEAVQQYSIDPLMCLPSCRGSDATDTSGGSPCAVPRTTSLATEEEIGLNVLRDKKGDHVNNDGDEEGGPHWQDACPTGDDLRSVSASLPSLFGGRFAESSSGYGENPISMPLGTSGVNPAVRSLAPPATSTSHTSPPGSELQRLSSSGSRRQEGASETPERTSCAGEQRPEAAVAAINKIRASQTQISTGSQDSALNGSAGGDDVGAATPQSAGAQGQTLMDLMPVFQQLEVDQKRNIQVLEHKLGRAFHSLNKKLDSGFDERKSKGHETAEAVLKMESLFQEFAGQAINGITTAIQKMVQEEVRTSIRASVNGALQKAVGEGLSRQLSAGLQRSVESVVLAQLPKTVNRALQDNFQESFHASIIPAFESAVQNMFGQIQSVFSQGLSEHVNSAKDLNNMVKENVLSMTSLSEGVHGDLAEVKSQLQELKQQMADVQRSLLAVREAPPTPHSVRTVASSPDLLIQEVGTLLQKEGYDEAFHKALSLSRVDVTNWLISKVDHNKLFAGTSPCPLRQEVLLSLLNQLGCDMMENTAVKLEWIKGVTAHLDPIPLSPRQLQLMYGVLDHLIAVIQSMIGSQKLTGQMMVSAKMALNMLMGIRKQ